LKNKIEKQTRQTSPRRSCVKASTLPGPNTVVDIRLLVLKERGRTCLTYDVQPLDVRGGICL
jgi:hypothetical protein